MKTHQTMQVASRLKLELRYFTGEAAGTLFVVECEFCGGRCGGYTDFPLVKASDFPGSTWKLELGRRPPTMTWTQFEEVIEHARNIYRDPTLELVPNSSLGPVKIQPIGPRPVSLTDIDVASPGGLLFSRRLIQSLRDDGFILPFQPTTLVNRLGEKHDYGIMQPGVYRMIHPKTFQENDAYCQCKHCGEIRAIAPMIRPPDSIYLQNKFRGKTEHLFRVIGYVSFVFVSDALKKALEGIKPSGLTFCEFGVWVD